MSHKDFDSDFDSLRPGHATQQGSTRRVALKAALGVGYAALVLPVHAQTAIRTSAEGLTVGVDLLRGGWLQDADYRASYRKAAAEDGWKRCLAWFKANGVV